MLLLSASSILAVLYLFLTWASEFMKKIAKKTPSFWFITINQPKYLVIVAANFFQ
jgi:hypothetical protein